MYKYTNFYTSSPYPGRTSFENLFKETIFNFTKDSLYIYENDYLSSSYKVVSKNKYYRLGSRLYCDIKLGYSSFDAVSISGTPYSSDTKSLCLNTSSSYGEDMNSKSHYFLPYKGSFPLEDWQEPIKLDLNEPDSNKTLATPILIGSSQKNTFYPGLDTDWFTFTPAAGRKYVVWTDAKADYPVLQVIIIHDGIEKTYRWAPESASEYEGADFVTSYRNYTDIVFSTSDSITDTEFYIKVTGVDHSYSVGVDLFNYLLKWI